MKLDSGLPFWLIKDGLPFGYPKLEKSVKTDVVILGGGISGALMAYHLTAAGISCVLLDGRTIGLGSTCASTSLLQYEIDIPLYELAEKIGYKNAVRSYELCSQAIDKLIRIAEKIGFDNIQQKKSLYFAAATKDILGLKKEFVIRKENGFSVHWLEKKKILHQCGFEAPAAILSDQGAQTDAYAFTHALLQHSIKKGLLVYDRTFVSAIKTSKKGVILSSENGYKIQAGKIVYATGYEIVNLLDKKIVDLKSTYAYVSETLGGENQSLKIDKFLLWNTADPYLYIRSTTDRRIIVGGRDEDFRNPGHRDKLIKRKTKQLQQDFNKLFPGIELKPEFCWTGTFGSTLDGLPFVGTYKRKNNSYFSLGFGGNGITFSLIAAEIITDLLRGKTNKNAALFSFERV